MKSIHYFFISILLIFSNPYFSSGQDKIHRLKKSTIRAKVLEISNSNITYKVWEYKKAPSQVISLKDVKYVEYENGKIVNSPWYDKLTNRKYSTFIDSRDNETYKTIKIGKQEWMAENLRTKKNRQGQVLNWIVSNEDWGSLTNSSNSYCFYKNDPDSSQIHGAYYTWQTAKNICPNGWHLPSNKEWELFILTIRQTFRLDLNQVNEALMSNELNRWKGRRIKPRDLFGFSAIPSGIRDKSYGEFSGFGKIACWWSSSETKNDKGYSFAISTKEIINKEKFLKDDPIMGYSRPKIIMEPINNAFDKSYGFSVRCVKN